MTESPRPRRARKILVPLTTLVAAGALTIGSGASFTSRTENTASMVASGTLDMSNSKANAAIFNVSNIKPGDVVNGDVTIKNTGTLPAIFSLTEVATNGFVDQSNLQMTITQDGVQIYTGTFGGLGAAKALGTFAAGESHTYRFSTTLKQSAGNAEQGKSASATYTWDSTQTSGVTITQAAGQAATATNANP